MLISFMLSIITLLLLSQKHNVTETSKQESIYMLISIMLSIIALLLFSQKFKSAQASQREFV